MTNETTKTKANKAVSGQNDVLVRYNDATDPIVAADRKKLLNRSAFGLSKYGVGLNRTDLSRLGWLKHAQQAAMDLAGYLEVLIQQKEAEYEK